MGSHQPEENLKSEHEQGQDQLADYFLRHTRAGLVYSRPPSRRPGGLFSGRNSEVGLSGPAGAGRFAKIGIPYPELMGPFVGAVETICGALIILGLFTRLASIPLIVIMIVAIASTKLPILLGHDFWIFHVPKLSRYGFWSMMHEARTDFDMLLGSLYLLIVGAGTWSLDAMLARKMQRATPSGG